LLLAESSCFYAQHLKMRTRTCLPVMGAAELSAHQ
jgi:hypothetical protein